jgi:hypothetical protein
MTWPDGSRARRQLDCDMDEALLLMDPFQVISDNARNPHLPRPTAPG